MVKLIIFDLDGTLLDTSRDINAVLNGVLSKYSLDGIPLEKTIEFVGNGAAELVRRAVGDHTEVFESAWADFSERFAVCDNSLTTLYEGEEEVLKNLSKKGVKFAIVTNKPQKATSKVCKDKLSVFGFCEIIGQSEKFPLKPDPSAVLWILNKYNIKPEECLFVGDGETDVLTAKRANIRGVSVLWGYRSENQLKEAGADTFCQTYKQLEKLVLMP